jgi:sec-independent protein translocase protein TatA
MPSIGPLELALILVVALVVFGPKRLPELGKSMGRGIREFKGSLVLDDQDEIPVRDGLPATAVGLTDESSDSRRGGGTSHPRSDDKLERRGEH